MEKNSQGFPEGKMSPELRFKGFEGEWEKAALQDLVVFYSGLTYSPSDIVDKTGVLVLRSSNIFNGEIVDADNVFVKDSVARSENVKLGDIVVVVRNGSRSLIGKHAQIKNEMPDTVIGAFMTGIRSKTPSFFNALLSTSHFTDEIEKRMGATINQITMGTFRDISFYIPENIFERGKVGNLFQFFDRQFSLYQKKLEGLKRLKHSMLVKMFPKEGVTIPEIRFKGFEGEWEKKKLGEIANKILEKNILNEYGITLTNSAEYGIMDQRDYFDRNVSNVENINGYYVVRQDDFVYNPRISTIAPVGPINRNKTGLVGVMSPLYFVFRTNGVDYSYLEYYFKGNCWHRYMFLNGNSGARSDRFSISDDIFMKMPIAMPKDIIEQQKIGQYFQSLDRLISLHEQKLNKLKNLKTSLLQKMFV